MRLRLLPSLLLFLWEPAAGAAEEGCAERDFLICVARLRFQGAPFDKNVLNVVFSVKTKEKLRRTCSAYSDVLPCFRDRIVKCGSDRQVRLLEEVGRMLMFFCSPFSGPRQELFLDHGDCISDILALPASTECRKETHRLAPIITQCKESCAAKQDFLCMMKIWISEQSLCTLMDIEHKCSVSAGEFYADLQRNVFNTSFPIICDVDETRPPVTTTLPATTTTQRFVLPEFIYSSARPIFVTRPPNTTAPFLFSRLFPLTTSRPATTTTPESGLIFVTVTQATSTTRRRPWFPTIIPIGGLPTAKPPRRPLWPFRRETTTTTTELPTTSRLPFLPFRRTFFPPLFPRSETTTPAPTAPPTTTPRSFVFSTTTRWLPWYLRGPQRDAVQTPALLRQERSAAAGLLPCLASLCLARALL